MENDKLNMAELNLEEMEEVAGGKGGANQQIKATGDVYVRRRADKESEQIGLLYTGDKVPFLGERKKDDRGVAWYKVSYRGKTGWVSSKYSKIV